MRIFLSYGHDSNEELVRRIKADLEKRGHDVWFDKSEIKFGDDWRHSITEGILNSNRVLSFLSKYSTRNPGVCRDEIAIAIGVKGGNVQTILVESEQEVQPPVNIGHIQWLDMHDWKGAHGVVHIAKDEPAAGDGTWEQWYQAKLAEIVRVVESDESRRFAGEIETLNGHLKPIKSEARICQLLSKGFYGRQWLFETVEKWRKDPNHDSRLFWIMGAPGVGKSAFAAQLTHTRGDTVIAAQFCEWDKPDHRNAERVVRSLAFQLATRLPDYRKLLLTQPEISKLDRKGAAELFDYLLANPLSSVISGGRERYLIVIDALDEAGEAGRNPLVEMLARNAQRLPNWLGLVVTSRPEFDVKTPLQALNPFPLDTQSESNRADIRDFLRRELASPLQNRPDADRLVEQILEKSEGVFLHVERFCDDVQNGYLSLDDPKQFPQGLGGIFDQYFRRQFPDLEKFRKDVRPALRAILAAREPLPVGILQRLFNWQDEELRDFARPLASLFPVTVEAGREVIKPYHKSLADWLADERKAGAYFVSVMEGHRIVASQGLSYLSSLDAERARDSIAGYWARSLLYHLYVLGDWNTLIACITNAALFQRIWPGAYGLDSTCISNWNVFCHLHPDALGLDRGERDGWFVAQPDALSPEQLAAALLEPERGVILWKISDAFAQRVRELQLRIFSLEASHGQHNNTAHDYLYEHHPDAFRMYRDLMYGFVWLARLPAEYALCAYHADVLNTNRVAEFLETYGPIHTYLWFLEGFAMSWRWSGALESEAYVAYCPWKRLTETKATA